MQKAKFEVLAIEDDPTIALWEKIQIEETGDFLFENVDTMSKALHFLESNSIDIILLDLNLPDAIGLEGLKKLRGHVQRVPVIVLTGLDDEQMGIMALQRGAQDYLVKGTDNNRLVQSMRYAIERMRAQHFAEESLPNKQAIFTERELQVLKLLGKGCTNQELVERLTISLSTVKTHICNILEKLSVSDRTKAVIEARNRRLI